MSDNAIAAELQKLATACRILEMEGHGDLVLGHLSWRDPNGRGLWMKRNEIGLGEVMGPEDFVLLDFDGRKLEGSGRQHSEWPIHSEIMIARPDVQELKTRVRAPGRTIGLVLGILWFYPGIPGASLCTARDGC